MEGVRSRVSTHFELKIEIESQMISREPMKYKFKRVVVQVSQTDCFKLYLRIRVDLMLDGTRDPMEGM
ncbi:uncharacterized protein G2W53_014568 [Senna tora]|uniref:Uncharacterized protein n=1 Tax=Senna tora TaxID=362788 RepID=A0A834WTQ4_9FABA|nr:uncharacterized protein G2W53_014568 [Senna tora]